MVTCGLRRGGAAPAHGPLEFGPKFKNAILDTEFHTQRLYDLLLTNPDLAKIIESEVMRTTYRAMRDQGDSA